MSQASPLRALMLLALGFVALLFAATYEGRPYEPPAPASATVPQLTYDRAKARQQAEAYLLTPPPRIPAYQRQSYRPARVQRAMRASSQPVVVAPAMASQLAATWPR